MAPIMLFTFRVLNKNFRIKLLKFIILFYSTITIVMVLFLDYSITLVSVPYCFNGKFYIYGLSKSAFILPRSSKVVYYGQFNEINVVIKKMRGNSANSGQLPPGTLQELQLKLEEYVQFKGETIQCLLLCPSTDGLYELMRESAWEDIGHFYYELIAEPLLLQFLRKDEGWPVPKYFGRCGDEIVQEYIGTMLSQTSLNSMVEQATIAANLLHMADIFTFKHKRFSFYFTDWSPDNLAVRENNIYMIDLENVIIVDRAGSNLNATMPDEWNKIHKSESFEDDVFAFSSRDVCSHRYSDHNFYAVCAHILARSDVLGRGILQDIPEQINIRYPMLKTLLQECVQPIEFPNRIVAGRQLMKLLAGAAE